VEDQAGSTLAVPQGVGKVVPAVTGKAATRSQAPPRPGPGSWPACATLWSPSCGWPEPPASLPRCVTTPAGPVAHYKRSWNA